MMNATRAALAVAATVALFPSTAGAGRPGPNPPSSTYPPARYWHNITGNSSPDAATSRVYMFGGNGGLPGTAYLNDLWYYRAGTGLWTLLTPTGRSWPQLGRGNGTISCGAGKCVMFGGTLGTKYVNETWYFTEPTGSTTTVGWSQVACKTPGSCPSARYQQLMAFDPTRHYHVMIGGYNDNALTLGDTWTFEGARWTLRAAGSAAPVRSAGSATFVPSHMSNDKSIAIDKVVIFGGDPYPNDPYPAALCDLWAWNGTTWEAIQAPGPKPCLVGATMAWDTSASSGPRLVVAGGFPAPGTNTPNTDTWYFTFATSNSGTWTKASPSVCAPLAFARGAYAASSKKLVFFGGGDGTGNAFGDTLVCP